MSDWNWLPPWSIQVIAAAAIVLVVLVAVRAWRERRHVTMRRQWIPLALRSVLIIVLLVIALNPTRMRNEVGADRPELTVLIDTSASMATADADGRPRLVAALDRLRADRTTLESRFTVDFRRFDRRVDAADLAALKASDALGEASDLASALSAAVADLGDKPNQAGVVVVSDGRATAAGASDEAKLALARGVPLWTWTVGGPVAKRDAWIETAAAETLAFSGADVEIAAVVHQTGYDDRSFIVQLLRGDEVIDTAEVAPGPAGTAPVKFSVTAPGDGEVRYAVRVVAVGDEADTQNNDRAVYLRSVGRKVRVLVAEGQPHWDTKFLVQALKRDERVDVTAIYRLGKDRQFAVVSLGGDEDQRQTGDAFPRTIERFMDYDVIVLGRGCDAFFDDDTASLLTEYVGDRGGSLIFSRGRSYSGRFPPLAKFEPVVWGEGVEHQARLNPAGSSQTGPIVELGAPEQIDAMLDRLPRFDQIAETVGIKPLATVLARATTSAATGEPTGAPQSTDADANEPVVMAYQLYGQGRVVTLNASGLWRWAFRAKGAETDEQVYDRLWIGMLRWLLAGSDFTAGHDVALRSDRRRYTDNQPMRMLVRTRGVEADAYRPRLQIIGPDGTSDVEPRPQGPAAYFAEAGPFPPGSYTVKLINNVGEPRELTTSVEVVSGSVENRQLSADPELMQRLAETSGGMAIEGDDLSRLDRLYTDWRTRQQVAEQKSSLWDRWWVLALALVVLAVEWFTRRREGLL